MARYRPGCTGERSEAGEPVNTLTPAAARSFRISVVLPESGFSSTDPDHTELAFPVKPSCVRCF